MADKIKKFLQKLSRRQLAYLLPYIEKIEANDLDGLDVKPIKGHKGVYRVRAGGYRIVFRPTGEHSSNLLFVGKRDDQTYRDF